MLVFVPSRIAPRMMRLERRGSAHSGALEITRRSAHCCRVRAHLGALLRLPRARLPVLRAPGPARFHLRGRAHVAQRGQELALAQLDLELCEPDVDARIALDLLPVFAEQ